MKARNPWHRLPDQPPFVLAEDRDAVLAFNDESRQKGHPHSLNLQIIPVPFVGRTDAPVVLLGNIAGAGGEHPDDYQKWPVYADRLRKNLLHQNLDFQFLPMGIDAETLPPHKRWWTDKLKHLLDSFGNGPAAEAILARSILAVEFFPYRSYSNEYHHEKLSLMVSQEYSQVLVYDAMENGAVIVIRYGKKKWFDAVRGLENYQHLVLLKEARQTFISPSGVADVDGYKKVVDKIHGSVAVTDGEGAL
jgi:hypothetical protein